MQISARNVWPGTVTQVTPGAVNAEITVQLRGGEEVVSIITMASVQRLNLAVGSKVQVVVKASNVMISSD
jgi:molybdate transport system regulatory protein